MKYYYIDLKSLPVSFFDNLDETYKDSIFVFFEKQIPNKILDKIKKFDGNVEIRKDYTKRIDKIFFLISSEIGFNIDKKNYNPFIVSTNNEFDSIIDYINNTNSKKIKRIA